MAPWDQDPAWSIPGVPADREDRDFPVVRRRDRA